MLGTRWCWCGVSTRWCRRGVSTRWCWRGVSTRWRGVTHDQEARQKKRPLIFLPALPATARSTTRGTGMFPDELEVIVHVSIHAGVRQGKHTPYRSPSACPVPQPGVQIPSGLYISTSIRPSQGCVLVPCRTWLLRSRSVRTVFYFLPGLGD